MEFITKHSPYFVASCTKKFFSSKMQKTFPTHCLVSLIILISLFWSQVLWLWFQVLPTIYSTRSIAHWTSSRRNCHRSMHWRSMATKQQFTWRIWNMIVINFLSFAVAFVSIFGFVRFLRSYIKWWISPLWSLPGPRCDSYLVGT